jgi:hypothetical protein
LLAIPQIEVLLVFSLLALVVPGWVEGKDGEVMGLQLTLGLELTLGEGCEFGCLTMMHHVWPYLHMAMRWSGPLWLGQIGGDGMKEDGGWEEEMG